MKENDFSFRDFFGVIGGLAGTIGVYFVSGGNGWLMLAMAGVILVWILCKQVAHEFRGIKKILKEVMEEEDDPMKASELFQQRMMERMNDPKTHDVADEIARFNREMMFKIVDNLDKSDDDLHNEIMIDAANRIDRIITEYGLKPDELLVDLECAINQDVITNMIKEVRQMVSDHGFKQVYQLCKRRMQED